MFEVNSPPVDVSVTIRPSMPIYAGDPGVAIELAKAIERGDPANVSRLELGAHTGTHVDAPRHFIRDGEGASELALEPFIGPCVVVEASTGSGRLDRPVIDALELPRNAERVLLKTPNSALWQYDEFIPEFVRLSSDGAGALI
ncbi:MAG: cyclase family protein [Solirubrobacteraceae bacterium]